MFDTITSRGLVLLGCGKMGSAMLEGWLKQGLPAASVWVKDPRPSDWLLKQGVHVNETLPDSPALVLVAVKPQMMEEALPVLKTYGNGDTIFLSVAAGTTIHFYESTLGAQTPVIRSIPNTPAAIGRGITGLIGNDHIAEDAMQLAEALLSAIGQTVRLDNEGQMDAVTAMSGSGPAYVFHLIEAMAAAGEAQGLSPELSMALAKATVGGAGQLAEDADETPTQLRINVTSPNGTTQAALEVLMDESRGFPVLMKDAIEAATRRSKELGA